MVEVEIKKIADFKQDSQKIYIYALSDPFTGHVRYIGKSNNIDRRVRRHLKDGRDGKTDHKSRWVAKVLREGSFPVVDVLEVCERSEWKDREQYYIWAYRGLGADLTNSKEGGDGINPSAATRAKMSLAAKGRVAHNKGKPTSAEAKARQSIAAKRRWARMGEDERVAYIAKMQAANPSRGSVKGWHHTEEAKRKISAASKSQVRILGYHATPEARRKLGIALKGHVVTNETRRKIGLANSSLTPSQVQRVRALLKEGELTGRAIAALMGTSAKVVSDIKRGKTYVC